MEVIKQEEIEQESHKAEKARKQPNKDDDVPFVLGSLHEVGSSSDAKPKFEQIEVKDVTPEYRKIRVPADRYNALKTSWEKIYTPIVEKMELQIRMNVKSRHVEIRVCIFLFPLLHTLNHFYFLHNLEHFYCNYHLLDK